MNDDDLLPRWVTYDLRDCAIYGDWLPQLTRAEYEQLLRMHDWLKSKREEKSIKD